MPSSIPPKALKQIMGNGISLPSLAVMIWSLHLMCRGVRSEVPAMAEASVESVEEPFAGAWSTGPAAKRPRLVRH